MNVLFSNELLSMQAAHDSASFLPLWTDRQVELIGNINTI